MVTSSSRGAYPDCFDLMDKAIDDGRGVRVQYDDRGNARHFIVRLNTARSLDRKANREMYEVDHPLHGTSIYDKLRFTLRSTQNDDGEIVCYWVYVEIIAIYNAIESLSEEAHD